MQRCDKAEQQTAVYIKDGTRGLGAPCFWGLVLCYYIERAWRYDRLADSMLLRRSGFEWSFGTKCFGWRRRPRAGGARHFGDEIGNVASLFDREARR